MEYPPEILDAVRLCVKKHKQTEPAIREAEKAVRALPAFDSFVGLLVHHAIQELVYDARHKANIKTRRAMGHYGGPAGVIVGASDVVQKLAAENLFGYRIAGTVLGMVKGEELENIAASEQEKADGHGFNARLARALMPLVPKAKTVQDAISKRKLDVLWRRLVNEGPDTKAA